MFVASALLPGCDVRPLHVLIGALSMLGLLAGQDPTPSISDPADFFDTPEPFATPRIDIYGNEIHEAIGDYRVDRRGELYERHAPDTAVLRLGPPGA